jgi:hypothetical protein
LPVQEQGDLIDVHGGVPRPARILWVSKIFDWFKEDFNRDIVGTFIRYAKPPLRAKLKDRRNWIKIRYLDYDWSLK